MRDEWIQGRFVGVYSGARAARDPSDPEGARRFGFEIESGAVSDFELVSEPLETDAPGEPKEIRQARILRVELALHDGESPRERPLFDVRIRDWKLRHPAESGGRSCGTLEGIVQARLTPAPVEDVPVPMPPPAARPRVEVDRPAVVAHPPPGRSASAAGGADAHVVLSRLRWALALAGLGCGVLTYALVCGGTAAAIWGVPLALALLLRRATRSLAAGPPSLHHWLGLGLLLVQSLWHAEILLGWWGLGCGTAIVPQLPWIAAPVVIAGAVRVRWPLCLSAAGWSLVVCASCWPLAGGCTPASPAVSETSELPRHVAPPRTDPEGRWPAMPSSRSTPGGSLSRAPAPAGRTVPSPLPADGRTAPAPGRGSSADSPSSPPSTSAARPGRAAPLATPDLASRTQAASGTPGAAGAAGLAEPGPQSDGHAPGGWVSPDHRRARRRLVRISVEHANRTPDAFWRGGSTRRVYLPTDPIFVDGDQISRQGELELARLANLLSLHPERRAVLEVHTDSSGDPVDQLALSERRARAALDWLNDRGHLVPGQLRGEGVGGGQPLVPPDGSHAAQQPNRRIEVRHVESTAGQSAP